MDVVCIVYLLQFIQLFIYTIRSQNPWPARPTTLYFTKFYLQKLKDCLGDPAGNYVAQFVSISIQRGTPSAS